MSPFARTRVEHDEMRLQYLASRMFGAAAVLRPGREDLVLFSVIAGVPADLVDTDARRAIDFGDPNSRDGFYNAILSDPRMQDEIDPTTNPGSGQGNLKVSCARAVPGEFSPSTAYPPRRLVQLAKEFGEQGMVQSICQDDLRPAIDGIVDALARHM